MATLKLNLTLFFLSFVILMCTAHVAIGAGRGIIHPTSNNNVQKMKPELFIDDHDGSFLIPGLGRYVLPTDGGVIPSVTGGTPTFTFGRVGGFTAPRDYIPGLDNTILPNPGVEIPNPFNSHELAMREP